MWCQHDEHIDTVFDQTGEYWDGLDWYVHSVASPRVTRLMAIMWNVTPAKTLELLTMWVLYSFTCFAAKSWTRHMKGRNGSLLTLTY